MNGKALKVAIVSTDYTSGVNLLEVNL
jgi:hypothetical protein